MPLWFGVPIGNRFLDDFIDHDSVFRVHADPGAVISRLTESTVKGSIVNIQYTRIGHEKLVGSNSLIRQFTHLTKPGIRHIGNDHVEGIIDESLAVGLFMPGIESFEGRLSFGLNREIDHTGGSSKSCCTRARLKIIGTHRPAERHIKMRVGIDSPGNHQAV